MLKGFYSILPLATAAAAYGFAFGVLASQAGFPWWGVGIMSFFVHAGSSQIVAVEQFTSGHFVLGAVFAGLALNLRYLAILASLSPLLMKLSWPKRLFAVHVTGDENWALTLSERQNDESIDGYFLIGSGIAMISAWVISTSLGALVGMVIPDLTNYGLGFAFTAAFIAMGRSMWQGYSNIYPWIFTFILTIALVKLTSHTTLAILLGSVSGVILASYLRYRQEGKTL